MEKAVWLSRVEDLPGLGGARPERLYLGSESCEHASPEPEGLALTLAHCRARGIPLTLVTAPCTDTGLRRVESLLALLPAASEVVFNDWGLLPLLREASLTPVHGRLLNRAVRDPRIDPRLHSPEVLAHLRCTTVHAHEYQRLMREEGVARVELDNLRQGLLPLPPESLPASLVLPFVHVSTARYCAGRFARRCPGRPCPLSHSRVDGAPLLLWGTASYEVRVDHPTDLAGLGVDRLVWQVGPEGVSAQHAAELWESFHGQRSEGQARCSGEDVVALPEPLMAGIRSVFEIGFGAGLYLDHFAERGKAIAGIDLSESAARRARARFPGADIRAGDFLTEPDLGSHDCVVDIGCFHAIQPSLRGAYAARVKSVLAPGGLYLVAAFEGEHDDPAFRVAGHIAEWAFAPGELDEWMAPELRLVRSRTEPASPLHPPIRFAIYQREGAGDCVIVNAIPDGAGAPPSRSNRFLQRLEARCRLLSAPLCLRIARRPGDDAQTALREGLAAVEAQSERAAAFWPDHQGYERLGAEGRAALRAIIAAVPDGVGVLLSAEAKGSAMEMESQARTLFDEYGAGAAVLDAPRGLADLRPFLAHEGRGLFVSEVPTTTALRSDEQEALGLLAHVESAAQLAGVRSREPRRWLLASQCVVTPETPDDLARAGSRRDGYGILVCRTECSPER